MATTIPAILFMAQACCIRVEAAIATTPQGATTSREFTLADPAGPVALEWVQVSATGPRSSALGLKPSAEGLLASTCAAKEEIRQRANGERTPCCRCLQLGCSDISLVYRNMQIAMLNSINKENHEHQNDIGTNKASGETAAAL